MSATKTVLVAISLVFGLSTLASAAPRHMSSGASASSYDIPGKVQQDRFTNNY